MKMEKKILFLMVVCVIFGASCFGGVSKEPEAGVGLTIYNDNFAVVKETRQINFDKGVNTIKFTDVASAIDPTSVNFRVVSDVDSVSILEQNYEYDLVNTNSLLKRYIEREVTVIVKGSGADAGRRLSGKLLAALGGDLILKSKSGDIEIVRRDSIGEISLKELPDDLVTKPTLVWLAEAKSKGEQLCRVTYMTERFSWRADYSAILNADETKIDFSGWVTIDNKSGAGYKDAAIKLIAGDVRRAVERRRERGMLALGMSESKAAGFAEKAFAEYHLYTLGRKSTINNNQVKQIEFIEPALNVPVKKLYVYDRNMMADKVQIKFEFENTKGNKLGIALPKGKVRVFKRDEADDMLEFVGEDGIDHTARKEKVLLYIGNAFDVVAKYTPVDSHVERRMNRKTHKIELKNRKDEEIVVFVDESFGTNVNWVIDKSTHKYEKRDAHTVRFAVKIAADSEEIVQYTVTQRW